MTEAKFFVQKRHRGVNVRSQLNSSGTDGVRGLQFVPTLNMRSAATASPSVDVELPVDDDARDISLELHERFGLGQLAVAAVGAARWQGNVVRFVDLIGHGSAMVLAVIFTAFTPWLFRIGFAFLAERARLAFAFTFNFFETRCDQLDLVDQDVNDHLLLFKQRLDFPALAGFVADGADAAAQGLRPRAMRVSLRPPR